MSIRKCRWNEVEGQEWLGNFMLQLIIKDRNFMSWVFTACVCYFTNRGVIVSRERIKFILTAANDMYSE